MGQLVGDFEVVVSDVDEEPLTGEAPAELAERLAIEKARAVAKLRPDALVIGGDTVVAYLDREWHMLAKPADAEDAARMLMLLANRTHVVITGVGIVCPSGERSFSCSSEVEFGPIEEAAIRAYVATGEPMDKAGGYAIQGGAARWIRAVNGSKSNVIGLPIEALERELMSIQKETSA